MEYRKLLTAENIFGITGAVACGLAGAGIASLSNYAFGTGCRTDAGIVAVSAAGGYVLFRSVAEAAAHIASD